MEAIAPDRRLAGRYVLKQLVASGGMATVWRARDEVLARPVALKILRDELARDPSFLERFQREAVASARLNHPGIVAVFDTGRDDGICYLVLEYVDGEPLSETLRRVGPMEPTRASGVVLPVLEALGAAHAAGLVHRDVKPSNILLGVDGRVKVADFGIAKAAFGGGDLTATGAVLGTVRYLSPEQVAQGEVGPMSDLYSTGAVLYEILTGRPPFEADTNLATAMMRLNGDPPRPRDIRGGIPRDVEAVVMKAMARRPAERFQSAEAMAGALERATGSGEPTLPRGIPPVVVDPASPHTPSVFRSWMLAPLLLLLVAVAVAAVGLAVGRLEIGGPLGIRPAPATSDNASSSPAGALRRVQITAAQDIDPPPGDGTEDPSSTSMAVDGDPSTAWSTDHYRTAAFGGLKQGVGLWVQFKSATRLARITVTSPLEGWRFELVRSASAAPDPGPSDLLSSVGGAASFTVGSGGRAVVNLKPVTVNGVLIWITQLAPTPGAFGYGAAIAEVGALEKPA